MKKQLWEAQGPASVASGKCSIDPLYSETFAETAWLGAGDSRAGAKCWIAVSDDSLAPDADLINCHFLRIAVESALVADFTFVAFWAE